ncbi:hypothetical protein [Rhizobium leguminosarum]|uniref:hypothetical protein n=1 Tax=Rhizobium leguminosarum TaxID=384 RepID=UPI0013C0304B|nr:hypothetical protein [Rhizobium leguminosarum]NEJ46628.1 hypothetical protein [Rhizobium leguminosarum]NEJ53733.1 hypothetical protein [Rhizobium leguminosarum]
MNSFYQIVAINMVSITLAISAGVLCLKQRPGWGWFLFGALATFAGHAAISGSAAI